MFLLSYLIFYIKTMAFFAGEIKAMAKTWILNGLKETPGQMSEI